MFKNITYHFGKLVIVVAILIASSVPAHAWEYTDFLVMSGPSLVQGPYAPSDGTYTPDYSTFPYWVGSFNFNFTITVLPDNIPSDFVMPASVVSYMKVKDAYGKYYLNKDISENVRTALQNNIGEPGYGDKEIIGMIESFNLDLGGQYEFSQYLDFLNWDKTVIQEIYDPASVRIGGNPEPDLGQNIDFTAYFNTGYPYDIASYTGNENVNYRLEYTAPKSTESVLITSGNVPLTFAQSATPLIAVRDSLHLVVDKPNVGTYRVLFDSDTWPVANKDYYFIVKDTVRAEASIDRDVIDLNTDDEITASAWVNYGFPYIPAVKPDNDTTEYDTVPTVRFIATLYFNYGPAYRVADTVAVVDEAFAENDLDLRREMKISLDSVKQKYTNTDFQPCVNVTISLNRRNVFTKDFPVTIKAINTAVEEISAALPENRRGIYDIMGRKIDMPFEQLPSGIYIVDGKKVAKR